MSDKLEALVARLETATSKLEGLAARGGGASKVGDVPEIVDAFENEFLNGENLKNLKEAADKIGGEVAVATAMSIASLDELKKFLFIVGTHKMPKPPALATSSKPLSDVAAKIIEDAESKRASKFLNHHFALKESFPAAYAFINAPTKPVPVVKASVDGAQFYTNRILKEYRGKDETHVDWVKALIGSLKSLQEYVENYHKSGLAWNPSGQEINPGSVAPSAPTNAALATEAKSSLESNIKSDFSTSHLKKVDDSMKTHKNPSQRATSTVPANVGGSSKSTSSKVNITKRDPVFVLEKKRWRIEHQEDKHDFEVTAADFSQTVYIFNCSSCTINVSGKINSIALDKCFRVGIIFDNVVSALELVDCQRIEAQAKGSLPLVNIDKSDIIQIYLSKESLSAAIVSSKSSAMNVLIPKGDEFIEMALPEQYKTVIKGNKLVTLPTESI